MRSGDRVVQRDRASGQVEAGPGRVGAVAGPDLVDVDVPYRAAATASTYRAARALIMIRHGLPGHRPLISSSGSNPALA